jgi:alpha-glucosidase
VQPGGTELEDVRPGLLSGWTRTGGAIRLDYDGPSIWLSAVGPATLRMRLAPSGELAPRRSWAVARDDAHLDMHVSADPSGDGVRCTLNDIVVRVAGGGGRIDVVGSDGRAVLVDGPDGGPSWRSGRPGARWTKEMRDDVRYYGFGERTGHLQKRGRRYTCWTTDEWRHQGATTDTLYVAIPFFMGVDGDGRSFGVFLHNTYRTTFDLTDLAGRRLRLEAEGGELDLYVFAGPTPADVVSQFTEVVGRSPIPPLWALGYHQSRWGYSSGDEVRAVVTEFRKRQIPLDAVHLDIEHMQDFRTFTWDDEAFSDAGALLADLGDLGVRVVGVVDAGVARVSGYHVFDEGRARDAFLRKADGEELTGYVWPGECVFPDHLRQDVREWWGSLYAPDVELGVAGFLNDMNEPAMHDRPIDAPGSANAEPPPETLHGPLAERVTHAEGRNVYALLQNAGASEGLRRIAPDERLLLLSRSGFAGVQRYAGIWTGDSSSLWEHLESSLSTILNLGLSGVPFAGADIGGFFGDCGPELLVRWTQLGALTPFARNHSASGTSPQEPWAWDGDVEQACRRAIELRYRLLPYLYTLAAEAARTGRPILRPLFFEDPSDPATHELADEAFLGRALLLAPVLRPGVAARSVYLPTGPWVDLRSGERHRGPGWIQTSAALDEDLPLFLRGGSILPLGPVRQHVGERPLAPLTLEVLASDDGRADGELYEDDGRSYAYERDGSARTRFRCRADAGETTITAKRDGAFHVPERTVEIVFHGPDGRRAHTVRQASGEWNVTVPSRR